MYKGLDAAVLKDAITKNFSSLEKTFAAAVTARIKDLSREKYS